MWKHLVKSKTTVATQENIEMLPIYYVMDYINRRYISIVVHDASRYDNLLKIAEKNKSVTFYVLVKILKSCLSSLTKKVQKKENVLAKLTRNLFAKIYW